MKKTGKPKTDTGKEVKLSKSSTGAKTTKTDVDALKNSLGVEGNTLEEIAFNALRKGIRNSPRLKEEVSKYFYEPEKQKLDTTATKSELEDYKEHVQGAFERISDFLKEKYGDNQTNDIWEKKKKEKSWDIN